MKFTHFEGLDLIKRQILMIPNCAVQCSVGQGWIYSKWNPKNNPPILSIKKIYVNLWISWKKDFAKIYENILKIARKYHEIFENIMKNAETNVNIPKISTTKNIEN